MASQPTSQHQPPPTSPSASQPDAIKCASSPIQSSPKHPEYPSKLQKQMKTKGFHEFLLCQPGRLQHPFWMSKASKVTSSDLQRQLRSSQAHPKCSLEPPKMTPKVPMWTHGANVSALSAQKILLPIPRTLSDKGTDIFFSKADNQDQEGSLRTDLEVIWIWI